MSELEPTPQASQFNLGTVLEDAKRVITNPIDFYRNMPLTGGFADPLIFVAVIAAATGLAIAILSMIGLGTASVAFAGIAGFAAIIVFPIMAVIGSFIGAAVMFVIWKLMGSDKPYEAAYRCVAYAYAIAPIVLIISIIPYLGGIVKTLWGTFLLFTASVEAHKLKAQTAKIVFGILAAIGIIFGFSSERGLRNLEHRYGNAFEDGDVTPEEAGKKFGEFMNGLQEAAKEAEAKKKAAAND